MFDAMKLVRAIDTVQGRKITHSYLEKLENLRASIVNLAGMAEELRQMCAHVLLHQLTHVKLQNLKS